LLAIVFLGFATPAWTGDKKAETKPADTRSKKTDPSQIGARDVTKGKWNFYSPESEIELGQELARDAERTNYLLLHPVVVDYVAEVAGRVARNSDLQVPVQVRVVDSSEVNAFALPGGHLFITTGMLLETRSEAELAGIIAHEIAHVAARHATRQMTRAHIWNVMSLPLLFLGGQAGYAVQQGASILVPLTFLKFSRNAEREADSLGLQYLYASGYDPVALIDFLERLKSRAKDKENGGIARLFSTHPMTKDRVVAAELMIERNLPDREEYVLTTSRHFEVRTYLEKLLRFRSRWDPYAGPLPGRRAPRFQSSKNEAPDGSF
jgi:predicted Zn-dependent protease